MLGGSFSQPYVSSKTELAGLILPPQKTSLNLQLVMQVILIAKVGLFGNSE